MPNNKVLEKVFSEINRKFGDGSIMTLGEAPSTMEVIPSGCYIIDEATGVGGYPKGRVIHIYGPQSSGKSTLSYHAIAECQKMGGVAAYIDSENALDVKYMSNLGVNADELIISQTNIAEEVFDILETLVDSKEVDLVIIDSVASLVPKVEFNAESGKSIMGVLPKLISQMFRKLIAKFAESNTTVIFINQIRKNIGVVYGSPEFTPGGEALKFYSSIMIDIRRRTKIVDGKVVLGNKTDVKITKNKCAPPFRECSFEIIYGEGINNDASLIDVAVDRGIIERKGAWYKDRDGNQLGQGKEKVIEKMNEDPEFKEYLIKEIQDAKSLTVGK